MKDIRWRINEALDGHINDSLYTLNITNEVTVTMRSAQRQNVNIALKTVPHLTFHCDIDERHLHQSHPHTTKCVCNVV